MHSNLKSAKYKVYGKKTKNNKTIYFIYTNCSLENFQSGYLYNLPKIICDT